MPKSKTKSRGEWKGGVYNLGKPGSKNVTKRKPHDRLIGECPECDADVHFNTPPRLGQRVNCSKCGARLEVIEDSPLELDWAFE
jgi:lysine biosynthesis protein LysW